MTDTENREIGAHAHLLESAWIYRADPADCDLHWANTRDRDRLDDHIESLKTSILTSGQLSPATTVEAPDNPDRYLLLTGGCRAEAVRRARKEGHNIDLVLLIVSATDDVAAEIVFAEQAKTKSWSAHEYALHLDKLCDQFGSNKQVATRIGLNVSNIGRNRNVTALPAAVLNIVEDRHEISASAATDFMRAWRGEGRAVLEDHLRELARLEDRPAAAWLVDSCREAIALSIDPPPSNVVHVAEFVAADPGADDEVDADMDAAVFMSPPNEMLGDIPSSTSTNPLAARRAEMRIENGEREVEIVLPDDQVVGRAKKVAGGAMIMTIDAPDQHPLNEIGGNPRRAAAPVHPVTPRGLRAHPPFSADWQKTHNREKSGD
ncbi:ParB N-terminal domain-containing protein [Sphingomonas donggukensis]|uniref:ParB N-terminal domain-containing protein n=1 Tax=Sphingomonas donggukensis TaxID=2949093 RepID=A0ABY4TYG8_9SPHN|nr:ParB N-terminal domain-containing protein [Sphingomonas donggukensis]URW75591.1 ParB N-terminal domain-containing protein [Sphingomonas donggukensis]